MPLPLPSVTAAQVATAAGLGAAGEAKGEAALLEARGRLEEALEFAFRFPTAGIYDGMVLIVAVAVAQRNRTPGSGGQTTTVEDGAGVRVARDPLAGVRAELARYVIGFA